jgi:hypothetical protein
MPIFLASEKEIDMKNDDDDHKTTMMMTNDGRTKRKKSMSNNCDEGNNKDPSTYTTAATTGKTVKVINGCTKPVRSDHWPNGPHYIISYMCFHFLSI